jgi:hypothetical protein
MRMQAGENDIFGNVAQGVPSPYVPHIHPYPTRYHGPIFTQPQFGRPYRANPSAVAPYAGVGDESGESAAPNPLSKLAGMVGVGIVGAAVCFAAVWVYAAVWKKPHRSLPRPNRRRGARR